MQLITQCHVHTCFREQNMELCMKNETALDHIAGCFTRDFMVHGIHRFALVHLSHLFGFENTFLKPGSCQRSDFKCL